MATAVSLDGHVFPLPIDWSMVTVPLPAVHHPEFPYLWLERTKGLEFVHCETTTEAERRAKNTPGPEVVATCWIDETSLGPDPEVLLAAEPGAWAEYGLHDSDPVHEIVTDQSVFPMCRPWIPRKTRGKFLAAFVSMEMRGWIGREVL